MEKVRVAIVGTGFIGNYHARALTKMEDVELVAVCDKQKQRCLDFAGTYRIPRTVSDISALAQKGAVDAVVLGIPNKFHGPYAVKMMEAGADVFIEKPLTMNLAEAKKVQQTAKNKKRVVMSGHMWRFDTEVNFVRDVVQSGKLGRPVKTKGFGIHVNWGPAGWFSQKKLAGGGALVDMGVHAIDTARYIMGDPQPKRVYASLGTFYGDWDVDDTGMLMIGWDNGATSFIESGWWQPHMDGPEAGTRVYLTEGYASLFPTELKFKVAGLAGDFRPPMPPRIDHCEQGMYDRQMRHFVDCVKKRKQPSPGLEVGVTVMKILDAAYKSSRTGQAVKI